jgi:hypothetical protein
MEVCDGTPKGCCYKCKKYLPTKDTLYKHRKACNGSTEVQTPLTVINNNTNNTTINNTTNNITINNTVNILVYPKTEAEYQNFDFITDKITKQWLRKLGNISARDGFHRFICCIFEQPENYIVKKTNPNVAYSQVHVGNNEWELALDREVYPKITHHLTTAALERIDTHKLDGTCGNLKELVKTVNEDDESAEYTDTIDNLKFIIINKTRRTIE